MQDCLHSAENFLAIIFLNVIIIEIYNNEERVYEKNFIFVINVLMVLALFTACTRNNGNGNEEPETEMRQSRVQRMQMLLKSVCLNRLQV